MYYISNSFFIFFCLISRLFANEILDVYTDKVDFPKIEWEPSIGLIDNYIKVTATVTDQNFYDVLKNYKDPPTFKEVELCFSINQGNGFKIFQGNPEQCDRFDLSGKVEVNWMLQAIHPGLNKINVSVGWKYLNDPQFHPIYGPENVKEILIKTTFEWYIDKILDHWYEIATLLIAFATLVATIKSFSKKQKNKACIIIFIMFLLGLFALILCN